MSFGLEKCWPFQQLLSSETESLKTNSSLRRPLPDYLARRDLHEPAEEAKTIVIDRAASPASQKVTFASKEEDNGSPQSFEGCSYQGRKLNEQLQNLTLNEADDAEKQCANTKYKIFRRAMHKESLRLQRDLHRVSAPLAKTRAVSNAPSVLFDTPPQIFSKVLNLLDTIDVFYLSLTCKTFKEKVESSAGDLVKFEHAITTHMLTFRDWLQHDNNMDGAKFLRKWSLCEKGLLKWCIKIGVNLVVLILYNSVTLPVTCEIVTTCPNLKHIQISCRPTGTNTKRLQMVLENNCLRSLESFLEICDEHSYPSVQVSTNLVKNCAKLRVYRGYLNNLPNSIIRQPFFRNLIALDLLSSDLQTLESLTTCNSLPKLKFFRIGRRLQATRFSGYRRRYTKGICDVLCVMQNLEFVSVPCSDIEILETLTRLRTPLKSGYFGHNHGYDGWWWNDVWSLHCRSENKQITMTKKLRDFQTMLLEADPKRALDEITIAVHDELAVNCLHELGFRYFNYQVGINQGKDEGLLSVFTRRKLGIEF